MDGSLAAGVVEHHDRPKDSILMGNRRAEWKVASRFVSMGSLLLLEPYASGAYLGNPGQEGFPDVGVARKDKRGNTP